MFDLEYKYADASAWREEYKAPTNTWNKHEFASVNSNNEVVGYISYDINRVSNSCFNLIIINFKKNTLSKTFGEDLIQLFEDMFSKFKFRKLKFGVVIGNPAEKFYDKYITKIGGRIVGIYKEDVVLIDGNLYDYKEYEVFREDFIKSYKTKWPKEKNNESNHRL